MYWLIHWSRSSAKNVVFPFVRVVVVVVVGLQNDGTVWFEILSAHRSIMCDTVSYLFSFFQRK